MDCSLPKLIPKFRHDGADELAEDTPCRGCELAGLVPIDMDRGAASHLGAVVAYTSHRQLHKACRAHLRRLFQLGLCLLPISARFSAWGQDRLSAAEWKFSAKIAVALKSHFRRMVVQLVEPKIVQFAAGEQNMSITITD